MKYWRGRCWRRKDQATAKLKRKECVKHGMKESGSKPNAWEKCIEIYETHLNSFEHNEFPKGFHVNSALPEFKQGKLELHRHITRRSEEGGGGGGSSQPRQTKGRGKVGQSWTVQEKMLYCSLLRVCASSQSWKEKVKIFAIFVTWQL